MKRTPIRRRSRIRSRKPMAWVDAQVAIKRGQYLASAAAHG